VKLVKNESSSKRESTTIKLKLTAENAKKYIIAADPNSKELKIKIPLSLRLVNDHKDPNNPSKFYARLVMRTADNIKKECNHAQ
jgi:hypothetical protein